MKLHLKSNMINAFLKKTVSVLTKKNIFKNLKYHKLGKCNICGRLTIFICTDLKTARNNMFCIFCNSYSRKRHVAQLILREIIKENCSISEIPKKRNIKIYNTDIKDAFFKVLHNYDQYYCSAFLPDVDPGKQISERAFCQNIEKISFDDESFDLVITEDVFEHIRDYEKGFREIFRILYIGGYHIFSVPCYFYKPTIHRVYTFGDDDMHILPPEYHGDGIRGKILAYRTFGIDIFDLLRKIGFETEVIFSKYADQKYGIFDSYTFVSRKMG
jgi:SAM-dependent methyltransferase